MTSTNTQIAEFRAHVASRLGVDMNAPSSELFKVLDRKLKASREPSEPAARDRLGIQDRRLYEAAWPDQPAGHHLDPGSDDQLYAKAWGSTEKEA